MFRMKLRETEAEFCDVKLQDVCDTSDVQMDEIMV